MIAIILTTLLTAVAASAANNISSLKIEDLKKQPDIIQAKKISSSTIDAQKYLQRRVGTEGIGGGGVYRVAEGEYKTLPEFGILIGDTSGLTSGKKYPKYYKVSDQAKAELAKIADKISYFAPYNYLKLSVSDREKYILIDDLNPNDYDKMKQDYAEALRSYGYALDDEKFVLPAYSVRRSDVTYILPDFIKLTPAQQAKILIHESVIRQGSDTFDSLQILTIALSLDVQINKLLTTDNLVNFDPSLLVKYLVAGRKMQRQDAGQSMLLDLQRKMGRPLLLQEITQQTDVSYKIVIDPSLIQDLKEKFAELTEGIELTRYPVKQEYVILYSQEADKVCKQYGEKSAGRQIFYAGQETNINFILKCKKKNNVFVVDGIPSFYQSTKEPLVFENLGGF